MSALSSINNYYSPTEYNVSSSTGSSSNSFEDFGNEEFLTLMIAELQNQDPLNPTSNTDMLNQINQMRQISSNDKLSSSLDAILLGQSVSTAANLLGKTVTGTNKLGESVTGTVDRVVFEEGTPKVYVGVHALDVNSITEIVEQTST